MSDEKTEPTSSSTSILSIEKLAAPLAQWHGVLGDPSWAKPELAAASTATARPGYSTTKASEYLDTPAVLKAKVKRLAHMIRESKNCCFYTGAGISTASGIGDYASKASSSVAPHLRSKTKKSSKSLLASLPTYSHKTLAAFARRGLISHWLQQNHDRLAQKAGFPQSQLNEIHGAWGDSKNPVVAMSGLLRQDLLDWMVEWAKRTDLCVAMGTSLCGMTSDGVFEAACYRGPAGSTGKPGQFGGVVINLQATPHDKFSSLRIWGLLDDVMKLLAKELRVTVPSPACEAAGKAWIRKHPRCTYRTPKRKATDPI